MAREEQGHDSSLQSLTELQAAADRARERYENEAALDLYIRALAELGQAGLAGTALECDLRTGCAECYGRLGDLAMQAAELEAAAQLAEALGDVARQSEALALQALPRAWLGDVAGLDPVVQALQALAERTHDRRLEARAALACAHRDNVSGDVARGCEHAQQAVQLFREQGDRAGLAESLWLLGWYTRRTGRLDLAQAYLVEGLGISRELGDRVREGFCLTTLGSSVSDLAQARAYYEQAHGILLSIGDRTHLSPAANNLGMLYWQLGLYGKACTFAERALQPARERKAGRMIISFLDTLARPCLGLGQYDRTERAASEGLAVSREIGDREGETFHRLMLGKVALARGQFEEARAHCQAAGEQFSEVGRPLEQAAALAWQGAACLELGDWREADRCTAQAVQLLGEHGANPSEDPPQEVWWWRYRALAHTPRGEASGGVGAQTGPAVPSPDASPLPAAIDDAWLCLDRAHTLVFEGIATLSDEGLRRNYLNKVAINREIVLEWTREALARGVELPVPTPRAGNVQDQLRRMMDISVRMNEERDVEALLDFVVDEMVELNGAERSLLVLVDEEERPMRWVARGVPPGEMEEAQAAATAMLARVTKRRQGVLVAAHALVGAVHEPPLQRESVRSQLGAPLVAQGRLTGMLYADIRPIFGAFDQADLDLLSVFAGQAATAVENARLYQGLETRVAERTQELAASNASLEHRNAELSIISSVQQGLAAQLDMQAIYELVGDKIREIFDAQAVGIAAYDPDTNMVHIPYGIEKGQRFYAEPFPLPEGGAGAHLLRTRRPLLINRCVSEPPSGFAIEDAVPGTEPPRSMLWVPLVAGGEMWGGISLQNVDHEDAFSEADVRLLSTLAASMSVALENARAYRRLEELDQAKSRFVRLVAHELRSPLSAIQSLLDVTLEGYAGAVNEKGRELMQRAQRRLEFLLTLVDDLLELAAGRMENLERERAQVDLQLVCRRVVGLLQARATEKGVALRLEVAPGSCLLWGVAERLEGLLTNLVSNAVKYTPPGGHVQVRLRREGGTIVCSVADTGIGIPEEALPHLFEEFYRAPNARALEKEGTGLGLAIAWQAAREHGSRIEVESKLGEGTVFTVTLQALP